MEEAKEENDPYEDSSDLDIPFHQNLEEWIAKIRNEMKEDIDERNRKKLLRRWDTAVFTLYCQSRGREPIFCRVDLKRLPYLDNRPVDRVISPLLIPTKKSIKEDMSFLREKATQVTEKDFRARVARKEALRADISLKMKELHAFFEKEAEEKKKMQLLQDRAAFTLYCRSRGKEPRFCRVNLSRLSPSERPTRIRKTNTLLKNFIL